MVLRSSQEEALIDRPERIGILLDWAATLLAAERGCTPLCRVKLISLATDIGLTSTDVDDVLLALSSPDTPAANAVLAMRHAARKTQQVSSSGIQAAPPSVAQRQRLRFRSYLRKKLRKLVSGILPPDQERRLLNIAWKRHALGEEEARQAIIETVEFMGIRRLTNDELQDQLRDLVDSQLRDATSLDPAAWQQLSFVGQAWRVDGAILRQLISERINRNDRQQKRGRMRLQIAILGLSVVVVGLAIAIAMLVANRTPNPLENPLDNRKPDNTEPTTEPVATDSQKGKLEWGDNRLQLVISGLRGDPRIQPVLDIISVGDATTRTEQYSILVNYLRQLPLATLRGRTWEAALGGFHGLDPDDRAARRLRELLLPKLVDGLPERVDDHEFQFWSVEVCIQGLERAGQGGERRKALAASLANFLDVPLFQNQAGNATQEALLAAGRSALSGKLYRQLTALGKQAPQKAASHFETLDALVQDFLSQDELEELRIRLLESILPALGSEWLACDKLIRACTSSGSAERIARVVDLMESAPSDALADHLGAHLLKRVGLQSASGDIREIAIQIRERLGGDLSKEPPGDPRVAKLLRHIEELRLDLSTSHRSDNLQQAVHVAQIATLAWALQNGETTIADFDRIERLPIKAATTERVAGRESAKSPSGRVPAVARDPTNVDQQLTAILQLLKNHGKLSAIRKQSLMPQLAQAMSGVDLSMEQGGIVARYLLSARNKSEMRAMEGQLSTVCQSLQVRLGIADQIAQATTPRGELKQLLEVALGREVRVEELVGERTGIRYELMKRAVAELGTETPDLTPWQPLVDSAQHIFCNTYEERLRTMGLETPQAESGNVTAGGVLSSGYLEPLIRQLSGTSARSKTDAENDLARIIRELEAVKLLDTTDIERTVLFQRILGRVLSITVSQRFPGRARHCENVVSWLQRRDREAEQIYKQLQDGEIAILRLCCLGGPQELSDSVEGMP